MRRKPRRQLVKRELLRIAGEQVPITLRMNPRAHRMIVKVHPSTGEVSVVAPSRHSLNHALDFARSEREWIAARLEHVPPPVMLGLGAKIPFRGELHVIRKGEGRRTPVWVDREGEEPVLRVSGQSEHAARRVQDFLKREARKSMELRVAAYAQAIDVKPRRITVRDTASRWGSCSTGRSLSFSWRLIMAPTFVLDYVVAHEIAHLRHMNHGARFWELVGEMVADIGRPQRWLNQNGGALHRFAPRIAVT
jgi:hypothetical protein